jgi:hypothetical protein
MLEQINSLSWEVLESPIYSNSQKLDGYKALVRSDNGEVLHVCKETYTPTRNEQFMEVVDKFSEITGFPIRMVSDIAGGKKILAFLECTDTLSVGGYKFEDYLMVGNSHDGSTGFFVGNSNIMVRCENRFSQKYRQFQVYHTKNNSMGVDNVANSFDSYINNRKRFYDKYAEYIDFEIVEEQKDQLINLIAEVTPEEIRGEKEISTRKQNIRLDIWDSVNRECNALGDNVFGLFNGVTHYTTHKRKQKEKVFGNPLGAVADINQKAFEYCNTLLIK